MQKILLIFVLCALSGCALGEDHTPISATVITQSPSSTPSLPPTLTPTATITPTSTPTFTPTPTPYEIKKSCVTFRDINPAELIRGGVIIWKPEMGTAFARDYSDPLSKDQPFKKYNLRGWYVSPDYTKIMYVWYYKPLDRSVWIIASPTGQEIWFKVDDDPKFNFFLWFDNERLLATEDFPNFSLLNYLTGEKQKIDLQFPDFAEDAFDFVGGMGWDYPMFLFNPQLTRVLYPAEDDNDPWNYYPVYFYSTETNEILASWKTQNLYGSTPIWDSRGEVVYFAANLEEDEDYTNRDYITDFYSVNMRGEITPITHFGMSMNRNEQQFVIDENYNQGFYLSPDNQWIALWYWGPSRPEPAVYSHLAVLDIKNQTVTDLCIDRKGNTYILWSPDSTQLIVYNESGHWPRPPIEILLIDLPTNTAVRFDLDLIPVAWLKSAKE